MIDAFVIADFLQSFSITITAVFLLGSIFLFVTTWPNSAVNRVRTSVYVACKAIVLYALAYLVMWPFAKLLLKVSLNPSNSYPSLTQWIYDLQYESSDRSLYGVYVWITAAAAFFVYVSFAVLSYTLKQKKDLAVPHRFLGAVVVAFLVFGAWLATYLFPFLMNAFVRQFTKTLGQFVAGLYLEGLLLATAGIGCYCASFGVSAYVARLGLARRYRIGLLIAMPIAVLLEILVQIFVLGIAEINLALFTILFTAVLFSLLAIVSRLFETEGQSPDSSSFAEASQQ